MTSHGNYDCSQSNSCAGINADVSLLKDYPNKYSGDGQPPSGMLSYRDDNNSTLYQGPFGFYKRISDVVPNNKKMLYAGVKSHQYGKKNTNRKSPYMPIPDYLDKDTADPSKELGYQYQDGRYNISHVRQIYPKSFVRKYDNSDTRFDAMGQPFEPRYVNWHPELQAEYLKHYYNNYLPTDTDVDHVNHANFMHHMKYASDSFNAMTFDAQRRGMHNTNNDIPFNHVEHNGRLYDCDQQPRTPKVLCTDNVYSDEVMSKCEAQAKFLGRAEEGHCSLNGNLPQSTPMVKGNYLIHDIHDASRHDLLDNAQVHQPDGKTDLQRRYNRFRLPNSQDYWQNYSYDPVYKIPWNNIGAEPYRKY